MPQKKDIPKFLDNPLVLNHSRQTFTTSPDKVTETVNWRFLHQLNLVIHPDSTRWCSCPGLGPFPTGLHGIAETEECVRFSQTYCSYSSLARMEDPQNASTIFITE